VVELSDGTKIGGGNFAVFAGPSAVESEEQILQVAEAAHRNGARILMGGAFKSRTSPYSFQGLGKEGLDLLLKAKRATGLPVMSELVDAADLDLYEDVDILQIGSRNMQNFSLLRELGHSSKPVLLKRGLANTVEEWLMSAEYILAEGNRNVILCERGIRSISESTRNSMDLSVVPVVHKLSHLPVVSDPCHAIGNAEFVPAMACAATAAGTDGLLLEIHPDPTKALCDGVQSIAVEQLGPLCEKIRKIREALK
jgi:3-deoxy-7-phosphoheptulonate synthase